MGNSRYKFRAWDKKRKLMYNKVSFDADYHSPRQVYAENLDSLTFVNLKDCEIMQYTGMKDKNSKEIFEGDIIQANISKYSVPTMGEVIFCVQYSTWASRNLAGNTFLWKLDKIEKIGNIFENPDMLKESSISELPF